MIDPKPHAHRPLTPRSLKEPRWRTVMHACGRGFSMLEQAHPDHPGFVICTVRKKRALPRRTFAVQGLDEAFTDAREAGHAWNELYADPAWTVPQEQRAA